LSKNAIARSARYHNQYLYEAEKDFDDPATRHEVDPSLAAPPAAPDVVDPDTGQPDPENITAEESTYKKRYGDLRRYQQEQINDFKRKEAEYKRQLAEATNENIKLPKSEAELSEWAEKYPDVYALMQTIARKSVLDDREVQDARFAEVEALKQEVLREKAENRIRKAHPDFDELRDDSEFHAWVDTKPKWVKDALYVNDDDPEAVIGVIDFYKASKPKKPEAPVRKPADDARAAASLVTRTRQNAEVAPDPTADNKIYESQIRKLTARQFEAMEAEIDKAKMEGRLVYDITGAAR